MPIAERMKAVRAALGYSQKEMGEAAGVSNRTWQAYELGRSQPNAETLTALAELGFAPEWLLLGTGPKRRSTAQDVGDEVPGSRQLESGGGLLSYTHVREEAENQAMAEVGVKEILHLARRGGQDSLWAMLRAFLEKSPRTFDDLCRSLPTVDPRDVSADLELLRMQGLLDYDGVHWSAVDQAFLVPAQLVDMLQVVRAAFRIWGEMVLPACRKRDHSGWMLNLAVKVPKGQGKAAISRIRQATKATAAGLEQSDDGETVWISIGAATVPDLTPASSSPTIEDAEAQ